MTAHSVNPVPPTGSSGNPRARPEHPELMRSYAGKPFKTPGRMTNYRLAPSMGLVHNQAERRLSDGEQHPVTLILAEWAVARGVGFLYASSAATCGNGENGFPDTTDITRLTSLMRVLRPAARRSKAAFLSR